MSQNKMQYQDQSDGEEDVPSISIDQLVGHGINSTDVQMLKDAGINTCNRLLKLTNQQVTSTGVAKVEKICEAANSLVLKQQTGSEDLPKVIVLCDEAVAKNILEKEKLDFAVKMFEKKLGGKVQVQLAVTKCTELSLLKANVILKDTFLTERCGHNPPICTLECVAKTAKAIKYDVAAGSDDLFNQLLFNAIAVNVFNAKNLNNISLCRALTENDLDRSSEEEEEVANDLDRSSEEEEEVANEQHMKKKRGASEQHNKKKLKRGENSD